MTIANMHENFRLEYDNISSFSNPEYLPEEVDYWLNLAQDQLILKVKEDGVEKSQTLKDYLGNITVNKNISTFVTTVDNQPNGVFVQLPDDYRTALHESVSIRYSDCNGLTKTNRIPVIPSTHDRINSDVRNPFKKPNKFERVISLPYTYLTGNSQIQTTELIVDDDFSITEYHLRYLRNPIKMTYGSQYSTVIPDVDCELNKEAQIWIIKQAAQEAFKATNQVQKYQLIKTIDKQ